MHTLAEHITLTLRDWISQGRLPPGERLEELPLCEQLGASRTPVRAALQTLASEGLLEHRPKRGYVVREFDIDEIISAYETRSVLEGLAGYRAARRGGTPEQRATLKSVIAEGDHILRDGYLRPEDHPRYQALNVLLHDTIMDMSGSYWPQRIVRQISTSLPQTSARVMRWELEVGIMLRAHEDHRRIVDAILQGEARRAEELMREHVYYAGVLFKRSYLAQHPQGQVDPGEHPAQ